MACELLRRFTMHVIREPWRWWLLLVGSSAALLQGGCGGADSNGDAESADPIRFQLNWYAQPERAGFYEAQRLNLFEANGVKVKLIQGGPNAAVGVKIASGAADIGDQRLEDVAAMVDSGIDAIIIGAYLRRDPQAIMAHPESGINTIADLDNRVLICQLGATYVDVLERVHGIDLRTVATDHGLGRFLSDKSIIQQAFVTNEPYYVKKTGVEPQVLLLSDFGYESFRVYSTMRSFAEENPEAISAFLKACTAGWESYLAMDDPSETHAAILNANPNLDEALMAYSFDVIRSMRLIDGGDATLPLGHVPMDKAQRILDQLAEIGFTDQHLKAEAFITNEYF